MVMKQQSLLQAAGALIRRCWLPLLLVCTLLTAGCLAVNAAITAITADMLADVEALRPEGPTIRELSLYDLPIPEGYTREEYVDAWLTWQTAAESCTRHLLWLVIALPLPLLLLAPVLALGLYRLLLAADRGESWRVSRLFSGFRSGGLRAIWLAVRIALRQLGFLVLWFLLASGLFEGLSLIGLEGIGEILVKCSFIPLALWLMFRYALAPLHLADDRLSLDAGDCIRRVLEDGRELPPILVMLDVWPAIPLMVATVALPWLLPASQGLVFVLTLIAAVTCVLLAAGLTIVYQDIRAAEDATSSVTKGFLRARALASGTSEEVSP